MVNVIKPKQEWKVVAEFSSKNCPFLVFPANYHGCSYDGLYSDAPSCSPEACPIKKDSKQR
jgi:hypothetical protein